MSDAAYFEAFAAALATREKPSPPPIFTGETRRVEAGLAVYRNNVRAGLSRVLADTFPILEKLVGEEFFKYLAHEFYDAHPPQSRLVAHYGDALPDFLESFDPARGVLYLADIARLEIAWLDAYHAPDAAPLAPDAVAAAAGDDPGRLRLTLHPSLRLLASRWPVASIWRHNKMQDGGAPATFGGAENILVARPMREVFVSTVSSGVFVALQALLKSDRLDAALEAGAAADPALDPQAVFQALFDHQAIVAVDG